MSLLPRIPVWAVPLTTGASPEIDQPTCCTSHVSNENVKIWKLVVWGSGINFNLFENFVLVESYWNIVTLGTVLNCDQLIRSFERKLRLGQGINRKLFGKLMDIWTIVSNFVAMWFKQELELFAFNH